MVWVGGTWVVTVRDGKVVHEKSFGADARGKAVVPTPLGVLLLTFMGWRSSPTTAKRSAYLCAANAI